MTTAWTIISIILLVIWLIAFVVGSVAALIPDNWENADERNEFYRYFSAVMAGAFVFAVAHWIVLLLAVPVFLFYGLWQGGRLLITKPWRKS